MYKQVSVMAETLSSVVGYVRNIQSDALTTPLGYSEKRIKKTLEKGDDLQGSNALS
jgi:hypothetical protein